MFQREPIQDLQSTVAQWYREHGSPQTVADVEQAAEEIARAAGAAVVEAGIAAVAENHQREANQLPCRADTRHTSRRTARVTLPLCSARYR